MKRKSLISRFLQQTARPSGRMGRLMLMAMNCGHAALARWGLGLLSWPAGARVLDVGCGGGANLVRLQRLCPRGRVYGVDVSAESVACSRRKVRARLGVSCFVEQASADALPFASASFDVVTAFETVYFWPDPARSFAEVCRVLRPGGRFLICNEAADPADTTWTSRIEGMSVYDAEALSALLTAAGFRPPEVSPGRRGALCLVSVKPSDGGKEGGHGSHC